MLRDGGSPACEVVASSLRVGPGMVECSGALALIREGGWPACGGLASSRRGGVGLVGRSGGLPLSGGGSPACDARGGGPLRIITSCILLLRLRKFPESGVLRSKVLGGRMLCGGEGERRRLLSSILSASGDVTSLRRRRFRYMRYDDEAAVVATIPPRAGFGAAGRFQSSGLR